MRDLNKPQKESVRVGCGAGFGGDRVDAAVRLAEKAGIDYIALEVLAERTIALANLNKIKDPNQGYNPTLPVRIRSLLPVCKTRGVRIISNMGGANPVGAAHRILEIAEDLGFPDTKVSVVLGDDVLPFIRDHPDLTIMETGVPVESIFPRIVSANAYLGADAIVPALETGADLVITGRVADPSLFLAPILYELNWSYQDYARLAQGTMVGHLLECAGQLTGGYYADPGKKEIPNVANLGFPYAEVTKDGEVTLGKTPGSGGQVNVRTCTEQLLYEVHDPSHYITPDCILDMTDIYFEQKGIDRVRAAGAKAKPRTGFYKVSVGYRDGYTGEGQISYAGPNALERARLAEDIVRERLELRGLRYPEIKTNLIGLNSLHDAASSSSNPYEVRLRIAAKSEERSDAEAIGEEVEALLTNGPAGGAAFFRQVTERLGILSVLLPRSLVRTEVRLIERRNR
jgi:hypothetical protein